MPFSFKELNLVGVSRIVDIHDRRSVTGNHCVRICCVCLLIIKSKAIITPAYPGQINLVSGCPGFISVLVVGIIAVICILPPVNDCIFSVPVRFPHCIERSVFRNRAAEGVFRTAFCCRPMTESIARSRRRFRFYCILSCCNEYRLHIACPFAAGEIQIMTFFDLRIQCHVLVRKRNKLDFMGQFSFCVPAGHRVCGIQRNRNIFSADDVSADAFLRSADSALIVQEEDIICLLENRIKMDLSRCAYRCCQCAELAWISFLNGRNTLRIGPAKEFAAGLFRCGRRINRFAVFDFLSFVNRFSVCIMENISSDCWSVFAGNNIDREMVCREFCSSRGYIRIADYLYISVVLFMKHFLCTGFCACKCSARFQ